MRVLGVDANIAGISGDMFISALIGLFQDEKTILEEITNFFSNFVKLNFNLNSVTSFGVNGNLIEIEGNEQKVSIDEILELYEEIVENIELSNPYRRFGKSILQNLITAEKKAHDSEKTHFHELGTFDTLIDSVVPAFLLEKLEIDAVLLSDIATGSGTVDTSHGVLPVPTPATLNLLQEAGVGVIPGPSGGEATTPTGASIIVALKDNFPKIDNIVWIKSSNGFGKRDWKDRANFARVRLGNSTKEQTNISILETNIDDLSSEHLGNVVDKLLEAGALDVTFIPAFMKKNRPGYILKVMSPTNHEDYLAEIIMRHTGTLGVRVSKLNRHIGKREIRKISLYIPKLGKEIQFQVKIGTRTKIEFDDLKKLSEQHSLSPLELEELIKENWSGEYGS